MKFTKKNNRYLRILRFIILIDKVKDDLIAA